MVLFVKPTCGERDLVVIMSLRCMCMCVFVHGFVCPSICLDLSRLELLYLQMDFKIIWHNCSP